LHSSEERDLSRFDLAFFDRVNREPEGGEGEVGPPRIKAIIQLAIEVWGDHGLAASFLLRPHPVLAGLAPLAAAHSSNGAESVRNILIALDNGFPA
jgi:uncharacterized protein (DUF2384 family)